MQRRNVLLFSGMAGIMVLLAACQPTQTGSQGTAAESLGQTAAAETTAPETTSPLSEMSEYPATDGTYSIYLPNGTATEDASGGSGMLDNWLIATGKDGTEMIIMQFPKTAYTMIEEENMEESIDGLIQLADSVGILGKETTAPPAITGLTNVRAYTSKIENPNGSGDAYLVYGNSDYAYYSFVFLSQGSAKQDLDSFRASLGSFAENPPQGTGTIQLTDTVRWFIACDGILKQLNNQDLSYFGGMPLNSSTELMAQQTLLQSWNVTDRDTADANIAWLLEEGQRVDFAMYMEPLTDTLAGVAPEDRSQALQEEGYSPEEAAWMAPCYGYYEEFGEQAIDGWDYIRAMSMANHYYIAGYYTEAEALDKSLEIASLIQGQFTSWDDLMDSYLRGYEYWSEESSDGRRQVYEDLKAQADSPYNVEWDLPLEKTW